ncbi:hypothetical protein A5882_003565 [Enterococcus sp. 4E1_DIV0656]|uniref:hypothetical protein n=1 Tax=Enterococcus sp. 4E1_DIV0656 TaxID=1834180 RepID=UPI000A3A45DC|nr:hypothetical protein [Enterococcus sp. 4E1_DIV0656]OTO09232.1 hypothetical protein A5882_003565 [Enterococcus sp. 4E1_DIV0656]
MVKKQYILRTVDSDSENTVLGFWKIETLSDEDSLQLDSIRKKYFHRDANVAFQRVESLGFTIISDTLSIPNGSSNLYFIGNPTSEKMEAAIFGPIIICKDLIEEYTITVEGFSDMEIQELLFGKLWSDVITPAQETVQNVMEQQILTDVLRNPPTNFGRVNQVTTNESIIINYYPDYNEMSRYIMDLLSSFKGIDERDQLIHHFDEWLTNFMWNTAEDERNKDLVLRIFFVPEEIIEEQYADEHLDNFMVYEVVNGTLRKDNTKFIQESLAKSGFYINSNKT